MVPNINAQEFKVQLYSDIDYTLLKHHYCSEEVNPLIWFKDNLVVIVQDDHSYEEFIKRLKHLKIKYSKKIKIEL